MQCLVALVGRHKDKHSVAVNKPQKQTNQLARWGGWRGGGRGEMQVREKEGERKENKKVSCNWSASKGLLAVVSPSAASHVVGHSEQETIISRALKNSSLPKWLCSPQEHTWQGSVGSRTGPMKLGKGQRSAARLPALAQGCPYASRCPFHQNNAIFLQPQSTRVH